MSKLSTLIYQSDAKSRFILAGAASAVARKRAMAGQARVFARMSRCCGEAYFSTSPRQIQAGQERGNPRRTPLIGKIAIYGWKLITSHIRFPSVPQMKSLHGYIDATWSCPG